jgi:hypothetical protein
MTEPLSRNDVIELLKKLGGERDEDVLEAARETHARITAAGMTWEELLVPEGGVGEPDDIDDADEFDDEDDDTGDDGDDTDEDDTAEDDTAEDDTGEDDTGEDETGEDESPDAEEEDARPARAKDVESLALIEKLLAKSNISTDLREELKAYKINIAEREFDARDRRYISAIHKRLSKRR